MAKKIRSLKSFRSLMWLLIPLVGILVGASQIKMVREFFSKASLKSANIIVDTKGVIGPLNQPWRSFAQGGESPEFSLTPFKKDLGELRPEYIRLDHLYDFYIKVGRNDKGLTYDFSKLDKIIKEMQEIKALPFLALSYMPDILNGDITGEPSNWGEYQQIIRATVEHVSGKSGLNVPNVYYEVWNEPDLFGQWKTYGPKNYLTLYEVAARGAESAKNTNAFKLGGPATTKLYDNWLDGLAKLVSEKNLRFDFLSWHHYTQEAEDYREDIIRAKEKLKSFPKKAMRTELIITEWGPNSENDPEYDGAASAAHLVLGITQMLPEVDKAFIFEIQDGKDPAGKEMWGRWGVFTEKNHIKPRGEVIKLLNRLGSDQLSLVGNGSSVKALSAIKDKTIQLLVANYDHQSPHAETVPVVFKQLVPGTYELTKTYLGRGKTTEAITVFSDSYQTTLPMAPNAVLLLEITPTP